MLFVNDRLYISPKYFYAYLCLRACVSRFSLYSTNPSDLRARRKFLARHVKYELTTYFFLRTIVTLHKLSAQHLIQWASTPSMNNLTLLRTAIPKIGTCFSGLGLIQVEWAALDWETSEMGWADLLVRVRPWRAVFISVNKLLLVSVVL